MSSLELKLPPPAIATLVALLMYAGDQVSPAFMQVPLDPRWAIIVMVLAMLLGMMAVAHFVRVGTTVHPHCPEKSSHLVVRGIYRYSRNPMYLSLVLMLVAWALYLGWVLSPLGWALFVLWMTRFQIRPEERILARLFGDEYRDYCRRVRRWL
ncbi:methyltransferase family protein [Marinobacterium sediminicola]|uniref:methyltransferase family protein n=1 Tax=Marinobacterium sediminicola TaxID=518898 RepID=UPI001EF0788C|nr:isoprenylcysteine carboxylmethyltransferase family protein [Marinobacterium sediminicola]ULG70085.1 isoprenylcysteine carboxylmethyltransferase family protein [Marinobacterium sediminicola]